MAEPDDPGTRGTLTIRNKAAGRIVERAALDVPGVVRGGGRLGALTGRALPRAIVDMTPDEPNIRVDIAVQWPMPIAAVCEQVQRRIVADLARYTDRRPSRVDVAVSEVVAVGSADGVAEVVAHAHAVPDRPAAPLSRPVAVHTTIAIALVLLAVAVVAGREFLIVHSRVGGPPVAPPVAEWLGRMTWQTWFLPAAIAVAALGLALMIAAIWPRRRTHVPTAASPRMWLRTTDVARLSTTAALHVDGVRRATTTARRSSARVEVVPDPRNEPDPAAVTRAVDVALAGLDRPPAVRVVVARSES